MPTSKELTTIEAAVLGLLVAAPAHGFALARELSPRGPAPLFFTSPAPVVYRALTTLSDRELVARDHEEEGSSGPRRVVMRATEQGRRQFEAWLDQPVDKIRQVRLEFMLRLALLDRLGRDPGPLIDAQYQRLLPVYEARKPGGTPVDPGFARALAIWHEENTGAVMRFLRRISSSQDDQGSKQRSPG